ncbi:type I toxin-antitoxin system toxin Ldr family protein [Escherichia coli]
MTLAQFAMIFWHDLAGALSLVALVAGKRKPPHVER